MDLRHRHDVRDRRPSGGRDLGDRCSRARNCGGPSDRGAAQVRVRTCGSEGSGNVKLGDPYLFEGLAAVIVGGTSFGARGDYWRTVLGALVLTVLSTLLVGKGYSTADQQIIFGVLILIVVAGYGRDARLRDRV